jgi:hypothetical protein
LSRSSILWSILGLRPIEHLDAGEAVHVAPQILRAGEHTKTTRALQQHKTRLICRVAWLARLQDQVQHLHAIADADWLPGLRIQQHLWPLAPAIHGGAVGERQSRVVAADTRLGPGHPIVAPPFPTATKIRMRTREYAEESQCK